VYVYFNFYAFPIFACRAIHRPWRIVTSTIFFIYYGSRTGTFTRIPRFGIAGFFSAVGSSFGTLRKQQGLRYAVFF
jgi:hypothetical protein